jgi:hypothetical protein
MVIRISNPKGKIDVCRSNPWIACNWSIPGHLEKKQTNIILTQGERWKQPKSRNPQLDKRNVPCRGCIQEWYHMDSMATCHCGHPMSLLSPTWASPPLVLLPTDEDSSSEIWEECTVSSRECGSKRRGPGDVKVSIGNVGPHQSASWSWHVSAVGPSVMSNPNCGLGRVYYDGKDS